MKSINYNKYKLIFTILIVLFLSFSFVNARLVNTGNDVNVDIGNDDDQEEDIQENQDDSPENNEQQTLSCSSCGDGIFSSCDSSECESLGENCMFIDRWGPGGSCNLVTNRNLNFDSDSRGWFIRLFERLFGNSQEEEERRYCNTWAPAQNTVCFGEHFNQTNNCNQNRTIMGLKNCGDDVVGGLERDDDNDDVENIVIDEDDDVTNNNDNQNNGAGGTTQGSINDPEEGLSEDDDQEEGVVTGPGSSDDGISLTGISYLSAATKRSSETCRWIIGTSLCIDNVLDEFANTDPSCEDEGGIYIQFAGRPSSTLYAYDIVCKRNGGPYIKPVRINSDETIKTNVNYDWRTSTTNYCHCDIIEGGNYCDSRDGGSTLTRNNVFCDSNLNVCRDVCDSTTVEEEVVEDEETTIEEDAEQPSNPSTIPSCSLSWSSSSITNGQSASIVWSSSANAVSATYSCTHMGQGNILSNQVQSGRVEFENTRNYLGDINSPLTETCILTVRNAAGSSSCSDSITVNPDNTQIGGIVGAVVEIQAPSCSLRWDKSSVKSGEYIIATLTGEGDITEVNYECDYINDDVLNNQEFTTISSCGEGCTNYKFGPLPQVASSVTETCIVNVYNDAQSGSCSASFTLNPAVIDESVAAASCSINFGLDKVYSGGGKVVFSWSSTNAVNAARMVCTGSIPGDDANMPLSHLGLFTFADSVTSVQTEECTLFVKNIAGQESSCSDSIQVYPPTTCDVCGDGITNLCDRDECLSLGVCTFTPTLFTANRCD